MQWVAAIKMPHQPRCSSRHYWPLPAGLPTTPPSPPSSTDLCRLLQSYVHQARKAGVPSHKLVAWVRRKLGSNIAIWRRTVDGELGCAAPCLFCNRELQRFDLRVHCPTDAAGTWFSGRLNEPGAPRPQLTGGQQKVLRQQGWRLCTDPQPSKAQLRQQQQGGPKQQ